MEFYIYNLTLINWLIKHEEYFFVYLDVTLISEFDLTKKIYQTHQDFRIRPKFNYIKGHQDNQIEYENLLLIAQLLNVEVDK